MTRSGFLEHRRQSFQRRPVGERIHDYREVYQPLPMATLRDQAGRCMDCGVPFCQNGCPLGNLIPEWNDLAHRDDWRRAIARLHATNNFPEFTGRLCPAPCEPACVLGINDDPVIIKDIEQSIIDRAFREGWVGPEPPGHRSGRRVAVVGSGPAGLAAAQQLNRNGHLVTVYERSDRLGGLLRYGIPDFKMEKRVLDRRLELLEAEGIVFEPDTETGRDIGGDELRSRFDAVVLAMGAERGRDMDVPGRELDGVHMAMDYLVQQNRRVAGDSIPGRTISAAGRDVVIIGGGDTGADCLGNAHRERCVSVQQLNIYPEPPPRRGDDNPWPEWPVILRSYPAHEEGGEREWAIQVTGFVGHDRVEAIETVRVDVERQPDGRRFVPLAGSQQRMSADLVLLAIGFAGINESPLLAQLAVATTPRNTVAVDADLATTVPGVFACGDAARGASLIVWAIAQGRQAAAACERHLATLAGC
ncbi:MAG: glutamate synthase subunit beta [Candidatus Dormibacteria bacterium]